MTRLRIGIGQINFKVGDFERNVDRVLAKVEEARDLGVEFMLFPEMAVTGYPMEDLAFRGSFIKASDRALEKIASSLSKSRMLVVVGGIETGDTLSNAAAVIYKGRVLGFARKRYLFCCGRFSEDRYFSPGERPLVIQTDKFRAAVTIGDDFGYPVFPAEVELLVNLWNEPYVHSRRPWREQAMIERAKEDAVAMAIVNPVGGNDDIIFEGASTIVNGYGEVVARGPSFREGLVVGDLDLRELKAYRERIYVNNHAERHLAKSRIIEFPDPWPAEKKPETIKSAVEPMYKGAREVFHAITLATRDFIEKNGVGGAIVGVSGGIDSALAAAVAREAIGPGRVTCVSMPGPYTSKETRADAKKLAENLGTRFIELPIKTTFDSLGKVLAPAFEGMEEDVTEENLQARIRGVILMALANKYHGMVLNTGNKSEEAAGYCTLYGDTVGGYAPLVDVYKVQVYEMAEWFNKNAGKEVIPESVIKRAPTAELKPGQKDQDSLPPYEVLDSILHGFLEEGKSLAEIIAEGEDPETVHKAMRLLAAAEFKRRQSPLGPAISKRPLSGLIMPITKSTGWWATHLPAKAPAGKKGKKS